MVLLYNVSDVIAGCDSLLENINHGFVTRCE